ncbi:hypothetical protein C8F04DRAFT_1263844 [Mycena alexandri]|uniref:Alpha-type protein kinase domain-containing protein n=1 Tax=Mycena alexandri TaxID=1745969 RepID=A0AAD6WWZ7_9AGAR|nr:hypothetical protein C8F04DRAFT_1263844 [Mycena alexandri]
MASLPKNLIPCGGLENIHDGCQGIFPYSNPARTLCFKCEKLSGADLSDADRVKFGAYKSCSQCGVAGTQVANPCGTCKIRAMKEKGLIDPDAEARRLARAEHAQTMFGTIKPLVDVTNHSVGPTTSAQELAEIRTTNKPALWTIVYQLRLDSKLDNTWGCLTYSANAEEPLTDVLIGILEHINLKWTKIDGHYIALTPKYCELGFKNNFRIPHGAETLTVRGLYMFFANRSDRPLALGKDTAKTKGLAKGTFLEMEVIIAKVEASIFALIIGIDIDVSVLLPKYLKFVRSITAITVDSDSDEEEVPAKRKNKNQSDQVAKRSKQTAVILSSRFGPGGSISVAPPEHVIRYTTIECEIDPVTGEATLEQLRTVKTGKMEMQTLSGIRPADLGKSKDVFKVKLIGVSGSWVAKTFFDIGQGRGQGLESNELLLLHDLVRLKRLGQFRDQFMITARETTAEVADFTVSDGFAIIVQSRSSEQDVNLAYLVEPLRTSTIVEKFSGTIGGSDNIPNKVSATMAAFTHFILEKTACRIAFTDLQGSLHYSKAGGTQEFVLFDPMSHSLIGNTGVGDHGSAGIDDTIRTHKCSFMCTTMKLASVASLKATYATEKSKLDDMEQSDDSDDENASTKEKDGLDGFILNRPGPVLENDAPV